jgi:hypothetical protein
MVQPLLTHAFGFPALILLGWIPVLLLDSGALGLGLNRGPFNRSSPGWLQPLPPLFWTASFPTPNLISESSIPELEGASGLTPPFTEEETEAQ